jgi:hypothetical protein
MRREKHLAQFSAGTWLSFGLAQFWAPRKHHLAHFKLPGSVLSYDEKHHLAHFKLPGSILSYDEKHHLAHFKLAGSVLSYDEKHHLAQFWATTGGRKQHLALLDHHQSSTTTITWLSFDLQEASLASLSTWQFWAMPKYSGKLEKRVLRSAGSE